MEDLVPMARKNRYAWGKVILRDTLLVFWGNFIQTWKSMRGNLLQYSSFYMKGSIVNRDIYGSFMNKDMLRVHTLISFPL